MLMETEDTGFMNQVGAEMSLVGTTKVLNTTI